MKSLGKYLTWFFFFLAVIGGIGTLHNILSPETEIESTISERKTDETLALLFAEKYLTIQAGETIEQRKSRLNPFIDTPYLQWNIPTLSQKPLRLDIESVKRDTKNRISLITIQAIVQLHNPNFQKQTEEATDQTKTAQSSVPSDLEAIAQEIRNTPASTYQFLINVPVYQNESGDWLVFSEPTITKVIQPRKMASKPFAEPLVSNDTLAITRPFIKTFVEQYYQSVTVEDIASFLDKSTEVKPKGQVFSLREINDIKIYSLSAEGEETKNYYAYVTVSVEDNQTRIMANESIRIYFRQGDGTTFFITDLLPY